MVRISWLAVPTLLMALVVQCGLTLRDKSVTYDEPFYIGAGYAYLTRGRFELNREHPPLMKYLIGLPMLFQNCRPVEEFADWPQAPEHRMAFGRDVIFANRVDPDRLLFWARIPTVVLSVALGLGVWLWTRRLYGPLAAGAALLLYSCCPNIIAHSSLATLDLGITAGTFLACFALWRFYTQPNWQRGLVAGLALAAALLLKYSAIVFAGLVPLFAFGALLRHRVRYVTPDASMPGQRPVGPAFQPVMDGVASKRPAGKPVPQSKASPPRSAGRRGRNADPAPAAVSPLLRLAAATLGVLLVAAVVVTVAYGLSRFGLAEYVAGFKLGVLEREKLTRSGYQSFLWGHYSADGFRLYHLAAFLIKTPIPVLVLTAATIVRLVRTGKRRGFDELFLAAPVVAFLVLTVPIQQNFGLRNILPIYPFLFVLGGGTLAWAWSWRPVKVVAPLLAGWSIVAAARTCPDYLAYFNELIGGPARGIYYLDDSNLDWGQDLKPLARYVREHNVHPLRLRFFGRRYWLEPAAKYYGLEYAEMDLTTEIARPQPGWYAISAHLLQRPKLLSNSTVRFDWLDRFQPAAVIGHSIYLYHFDARP
jgi:hypothetical protein